MAQSTTPQIMAMAIPDAAKRWTADKRRIDIDTEAGGCPSPGW